MTRGTLYLIPTTLGDTSPEDLLPGKTLSLIRSLSTFIVEEIKPARWFLRKAGYTGNFEAMNLQIFNEHTDRNDLMPFIQPMLDGIDTGLLSEAGTPCIADPGAEIVELAHQVGIKVVPLSGPSSILLALSASGFNGQNFVFHGYLPIEKRERQRKIKEIERAAYDKDQTQIFIETPYRNTALLGALSQTCKPSSRLCMAINLTTAKEQILVQTIADWRVSKTDVHKKPAVFLLYR
ncbi:MAG: SAM-dependent methyltransferase [Bacteroidales bacterium]|nr:SAM-dependent methyltransferase [Bacteroidota bacterium]MBL6949416.1 SAM-dependent methyltransferase [Bacteroidales bacterium]